MATGIEQGVKATQAAYAEQLQGLERELQKASEYGPRIEMSRAFPSRPDELLDLGIKLPAGTDLKRLREYGLPVTTFLSRRNSRRRRSRESVHASPRRSSSGASSCTGRTQMSIGSSCCTTNDSRAQRISKTIAH